MKERERGRERERERWGRGGGEEGGRWSRVRIASLSQSVPIVHCSCLPRTAKR